MWRGRVVEEAAPRNRVQLCCRDCCVVVAVGGSSRWATVARMGDCRATLVEAIEEIVIRVPA